MKINLINELSEDSRFETVTTANRVYSWFLRKAFIEEGVDARFIYSSKLLKEILPKTDHTIVILSANHISLLHEGGYLSKIRSSTTGKTACYVNTNKLQGNSDQYFDYCFTKVESHPSCSEKYVCVGWGVDPAYSYPEQNEKAAFLDSKVLFRWMRRKVRKAYQIYDSVLPKLGIKIYNPIPIYNESRRISYLDYQSILRKCHYFLCTQLGVGGTTSLEAAACGALLVVPSKLYSEKTHGFFNHRIWYTEEDLIKVLNEDVMIEANRKRTLEYRWKNVVRRILKLLENDDV